MSEMLSPHFSLAELTASDTAARLGIDNTPPPDARAALVRTALGLETVRALLGVPLLVSSGYRCPALNKLVGGQPNSQHMRGEAADFTAPQYGPPAAIVKRLDDYRMFDQLILEFGRWVHVSFADKPRREVLVIDAKGTRPWTP
jgi:hypothetical protein